MGLLGRKKNKAQPAVQPAHVSPTSAMSVSPVPLSTSVASEPWDSSKFKIHLKMAKNRVDIQRGKKENEIESIRRVIAGHLSTNKEPLARIQGERVLRERTLVIAYDILDTCIELLISSNGWIASNRDLDAAPTDVKESVTSVVFATPRTNIPELITVVSMLRSHFGAHVIDPIAKLEGPHVHSINKPLAHKLSGGAPDGYLVLEELHRIAVQHELNWTPPPEESDLNYVTNLPSHQQHNNNNNTNDNNNSNSGPPPSFGGSGGSGSGYLSSPSAPHPSVFQSTTYVPQSQLSSQQPPMPPSNIPGFSTGPDPSPYAPSAPPSFPPPPPSSSQHAPYAPPFDPAANASGSLYPRPDGSRGMPPTDGPDTSVLNDADIEARFRAARDNK